MPQYDQGYEDALAYYNKKFRPRSDRDTEKFLSNFNPEKSSRETRKLERKIYTEKSRTLYNDKGILVKGSVPNKDLCDCLDRHCTGCHFPCPRCFSQKCGIECRRLRKWVHTHYDVEGTDRVVRNPYYN